MKTLLTLLLSAACCYGQAVLQNAYISNASIGGTNGGTSGSAPAFVQSAKTNYLENIDAFTVVTFTNNIGAGHCIVVLAGGGSTNSCIGVLDTLGNTYTLVTNAVYAASTYTLDAYVATNTTAGACTVTVQWFGSANYNSAVIAEYSGVALFNPVDVYSSKSNATGGAAPATLTSDSATASTSNELAVALWQNNLGSVTAGSGWTQREIVGGLLEDKAVSAGAVQATASDDTSSDPYCAVLLILKHQ